MSNGDVKDSYFKALRAEEFRFALEYYFWLCLPGILLALEMPLERLGSNIVYALWFGLICAVVTPLVVFCAPFLVIVAFVGSTSLTAALKALCALLFLYACLGLIGYRASILARFVGGLFASVIGYYVIMNLRQASF